MVRLRRAGASVSASTPSGRAGPGVRAGRGGARDGVVRSAEWPVRTAGPHRANGANHDDEARPFDGPRDDRAADVSGRLSVSLTHAVPFGFAVSLSFTGSIEARCGMWRDEECEVP
jgi:hypothetical protein